MTKRLFTRMSDDVMASEIDKATTRIVVVAPGIRNQTAHALRRATDRISADRIVVVLDCDEEVFRLGYGDLESLERIRQGGISVQHSPGLRFASLVCDDKAWAFTPTALYVEDEVHSSETPNAFSLSENEADHIAMRVSAKLRGHIARATLNPQLRMEAESAETEIGIEQVSDQQVQQSRQALEVAPPVAFDVARMVRVFHPYIQYVTIKLEGCAIQRRTVRMPQALIGIGQGKEIVKRLHTTFDLIEKNSKVSSKPLEIEMEEIRKIYTRSLGKPWGRVLLRAKRSQFDERIESFKRSLDEYRETVKKDLQTHIDKSRQDIVNLYQPIVKESPPEVLSGQITTAVPDDQQAKDWLEAELQGVFPSAESLIEGMTLSVHYQDVTYETLKQEGFTEKLCEVFPHVDWDKPFHEFQAAGEKAQANP